MTGAKRRAVAVLFDVDGTLVDSTYLHAVSWWQAFRQAGIDLPLWRFHRAIGMGADQLVPHLVGRRPDIDADRLAESHDAIYSTWWPSLRLLPGAKELVRRCHDHGLVTVLATSAGDAELRVLRALLDLDDVLDHVTSADDVRDSKPAPDLVSVALDRAETAPEDAVFIGDAVWDALACRAAGVRCIGLECGGTGAEELRTAGAAPIYRDPADLLAGWRGSPLDVADTGLGGHG